jgi:hypothetical protein
MVGDAALVRVGGGVERRQEFGARVRQRQRHRAAVAGHRCPTDEAAPHQRPDEADEVRRLDGERVGDLRLRGSRVGLDQRQHRVLRRRDREPGEGREKILEDRKLGPAEQIAEPAVERALAQHRGERSSPGRRSRRPPRLPYRQDARFAEALHCRPAIRYDS